MDIDTLKYIINILKTEYNHTYVRVYLTNSSNILHGSLQDYHDDNFIILKKNSVFGNTITHGTIYIDIHKIAAIEISQHIRNEKI